MRIAIIILLMPWLASITAVTLATLAYLASNGARRRINIMLVGESPSPIERL